MRGFKALAKLSVIVTLAITIGIPASAQTPADDAAWKKVDDAMSAVTHGPPTPPKSAEESKAMLTKVMQALEKESKDFQDKFPNDPRNWKVKLFKVTPPLPNYRNAAGLPPAGDIKTVAAEVINSPNASAEIKGTADGILVIQAGQQNGQSEEWLKLAEKHLQMYPQGEYNKTIEMQIETAKMLAELKTKPMDLKFTAVDGTKVDLAKMHGKVVMVDFWATWCGPCVQEVPNVVAAYNKLHKKGFEIVGISLDRQGDKPKLEAFTKEHGMPWPQYYDGKWWENEISTRFGIHSIPAMWLVNKKGMLVTTDGRTDLEKQVEALLAE